MHFPMTRNAHRPLSLPSLPPSKNNKTKKNTKTSQPPQPLTIEHPFVEAIAKDARSYDRAVFARGAGILSRFGLKDADAIQVWEEMSAFAEGGLR